MSRIIIVSGAGTGLGEALSRALVERGDVVIGIGRRAALLENVRSSLPEGRFIAEPHDVSDPVAMRLIVDRTMTDHGRIDGLFANAAIYPRVAFADQDPAVWMETMNVNVGGVVNLCHAALRVMYAQARGRIICVGSFADRAPIAESSAYSASKGALHALVKAIAVEVGPDYPDILVNEWVPGRLRTTMGIETGIDPAQAATWGVALLDLPAGGATGQIFVRDRQEMPPRSLKRRIVDKILRR